MRVAATKDDSPRKTRKRGTRRSLRDGSDLGPSPRMQAFGRVPHARPFLRSCRRMPRHGNRFAETRNGSRSCLGRIRIASFDFGLSDFRQNADMRRNSVCPTRRTGPTRPTNRSVELRVTAERFPCPRGRRNAPKGWSTRGWTVRMLAFAAVRPASASRAATAVHGDSEFSVVKFLRFCPFCPSANPYPATRTPQLFFLFADPSFGTMSAWNTPGRVGPQRAKFFGSLPIMAPTGWTSPDSMFPGRVCSTLGSTSAQRRRRRAGLRFCVKI